MEQLNKIIVRGPVGYNRFNVFEGNGHCRFSVVTNFAYHDREGQPVIETYWHNIVAWEGRGISLEDLKKVTTGKIVQVEGRLRINKYVSTEGTEKQVDEIVANSVKIFEGDEPVSAQMSM